MISKNLLLTGLGVAALGLSLAVASPALAITAAPTLPSSDAFFAIDCDGDDSPAVWNLLPTGAATPIGTDTSVSCGGGASYDQITKLYYFIEYTGITGEHLSTFDPTTGIVTHGPLIYGDMDSPWQLSIDASGNAFVTGGDYVDAAFDSINLTTGMTTNIGALDHQLEVMAFNPVDNLLYGFGYENGEVYTVDTSNGHESILHSGVTYTTGFWPAPRSSTVTGTNPYSVAFDSNGIAWIDMYGMNADVEAYNPVTNESWSTGTLVDATHLVHTSAPYDWYGQSFVIGQGVNAVATPAAEPELAVTGTNATAMGLLAGGSALVALMGASIVIATRRRKARN